MKAPLKTSSLRGFTLVELLAVIAIIGVLVAIFFSVTSRIKESARNTQCASNSRQLGASILAYAADNKSQLPHLSVPVDPNDSTKGTYSWMQLLIQGGYLRGEQNAIYGFATGVWACPEADPTSGDASGNINNHSGGLGVLSGILQNASQTNKYGTLGSARLSQIVSPARTWLIGDASRNNNPLYKNHNVIGPLAGGTFAANFQQPAPRHRGRINVCHFDGHIGTYTLVEAGDIAKGPIPFTQ